MLSISSSCRHTLNGDCLLTECTQCHHRDDGWGRARGRITLAGAAGMHAGKRVRMHACMHRMTNRARRRSKEIQFRASAAVQSPVFQDTDWKIDGASRLRPAVSPEGTDIFSPSHFPPIILDTADIPPPVHGRRFCTLCIQNDVYTCIFYLLIYFYRTSLYIQLNTQ